MSTNEQFTDVSEFLPTWNPTFKGSKKTNDLVLLPANDKSFIIGWYIGKRETIIGTDNRVIHKIRATSCGDPTHFNGTLDSKGTDCEFFGTSVINNQLAEHVTPGQAVKVQWMGKVKAKTEGGRPYNLWKVFLANSIAPILVSNGVVSNSSMLQQDVVSDNPAGPPGDDGNVPVSNTSHNMGDDTDDDLPF